MSSILPLDLIMSTILMIDLIISCMNEININILNLVWGNVFQFDNPGPFKLCIHGKKRWH